MLVVDRDDRASAENLVQEMEDLCAKCEVENYCTEKETRERLDVPKPKLQERVFAKDLNTGGKDKIPRVVSSSFS